MKHLKRYKIFESMFDTSSLEDILLDLTDEGYGWNISVGKNSKGKSNLSLNISFTFIPDWKSITPCILRIDKYLISEGYTQGALSADIIEEMENGYFDPDNWIPDYGNAKQAKTYYFQNGGQLDLELNYKK